MKAFSLIAIIFMLITASIGSSNSVYICNGPNSLRFHYSPKCVGLKNCSTRLEKISISEARKRGRTLCGHEK